MRSVRKEKQQNEKEKKENVILYNARSYKKLTAADHFGVLKTIF